MRWLQNLSLRARTYLLVGVGLAIILGIFAFLSVRALQESTDRLLAERLRLAQLLALHIDDHVAESLALLERAAASEGFDPTDADPEPERRALRELYAAGFFTHDVFLTDRQGRVVWMEPAAPAMIGTDLSAEPEIQQALQTGKPQVSNLVRFHDKTKITFIAPVKDRQGNIVGLIGGAADPAAPSVGGIVSAVQSPAAGHVDVVDANGVVLASTDPAHAAEASEHRAALLPALQSRQPQVGLMPSIEDGVQEEQHIVAFALLSQAPWGVAIGQSQAEALAPVRHLQQWLILIGAVILLASVAFVGITTQAVVTPIHQLLSAARRVAAGDLTTPVTVVGRDEVAELGRGFETMRRKLSAWGEELETAVQKRTRELSTLYAIDRAAAQSLNLDEILNDSLDKVLEVMEVEAGGILLLEPDGETLRLRVYRGLSDEFVQHVNAVKVGEGLSGRAAAEQKPVTMDIAEYPLERLAPFIVKEGLQSLASVPLVSAGELVGALNLATRRPRAFPPEELELLTAIGRQLGGAVANARLHQQLQLSEQQYRILVENSTEVIWTLDTEGNFTFVNRQAEQVSGYKLKEWLGRSFAPLIPPEDLPRIQQVFLETLAGKPQNYDVRVYRADGSLFYLSVNTAPLYRDGQVVGTISFARDVTAQREAEAALRQRLAELSALFEVSSALRGAATVEEMLPIILKTTIAVIHADAGVILLSDRAAGDQVVRAAEGLMAHLLGTRLTMNDHVPSRVLSSGQPYIIRHVATEPLIPPALRERLQGIETAIVLPLHVGETAVGAMNIAHAAPHTFTDDEVRLLTAIADMAASAIHRASLFEQLDHRVHELSALFDVGKMATATLHIEDVQDFVVGAAAQTLHAESSYLFLWDEQEERLVMQAVHGFSPELVGQVKYRMGEGLSGWVFLESKVANVPDVAADPRWKQEPEQERTSTSGRITNALVVPLVVGDKTLGVLGVANKIGAPAFTSSDESLLVALGSEVAIAIENARLYEDVRELSIATIRSLATTIDARDPYTRGHSEQVTRLAVQVAREMGWNGADLEMLEFAALLHDAGKIAVPDAILRKVEPLTPDDWDIIRMHPYHSAQIIKPVKPLQRIIPWVYHHQEKWDGSGYPDGLQGEAIPLAARIIAVVDAFNAMTTDRPYRKGLPRDMALAEIKRCAGTQFDPRIVETFLQVLGDGFDITGREKDVDNDDSEVSE